MDETVELITSFEAETCRLANDLSNYARAGDFIGLSGDLGAGKSVFARAFLRALAGNADLEVPSPTFTLVQAYEGLRIKAAHFDLYRILDSAEVDELGLQDALIEGLVVVEWPDRIDEHLFGDRLRVTIDDISPTQRKITLSGFGTWQHRLKRWQLSNDFLQQAGWGSAHRNFLQGDASHRRYERLRDKQRHAVLMDMPTKSDGPVIRGGKPYSVLAHLAEGVAPFITMTKTLRQLDLSAPQIFANQPEDGFLLLEDLGARVYFDMAAGGEDMTAPMHAAIDVLVHLAEKFTPLPENPAAPAISAYDQTALQIEVELLPDWYWPHLKNQAIAPDDRAEFLELWQPLWQHLEDGPRICALRDYHSPNLVWMPQRSGIARVGLLDYQDAVLGPPAYDLMSLLQDARRDVSKEVEAEMYSYYWQGLARTDVKYDRDDFDLAYAILGAQRATKILGIFARLAARDHKPAYLAHLPRIRAYLERNLRHTQLKPLRHWFDRHLSQEP